MNCKDKAELVSYLRSEHERIKRFIRTSMVTHLPNIMGAKARQAMKDELANLKRWSDELLNELQEPQSDGLVEGKSTEQQLNSMIEVLAKAGLIAGSSHLCGQSSFHFADCELSGFQMHRMLDKLRSVFQQAPAAPTEPRQPKFGDTVWLRSDVQHDRWVPAIYIDTPKSPGCLPAAPGFIWVEFRELSHQCRQTAHRLIDARFTDPNLEQADSPK